MTGPAYNQHDARHRACAADLRDEMIALDGRPSQLKDVAVGERDLRDHVDEAVGRKTYRELCQPGLTGRYGASVMQ
jgi:hypothetical protein